MNAEHLAAAPPTPTTFLLASITPLVVRCHTAFYLLISLFKILRYIQPHMSSNTDLYRF
jgi:hypothetical protein